MCSCSRIGCNVYIGDRSIYDSLREIGKAVDLTICENEARAMTLELSSSRSRVTSHDGSGNIDANHSNGSHAYAVAVQDAESDDAAEKKRKSKRKKQKIGICRTIYEWKLEIVALTLMALIVASEVRRHSQDRPSSTSTSLDGKFSAEVLNVNGTNFNIANHDDDKPSNLNNMEMPYRKGVACLQLLPADELMQLKLPHKSTIGPVENLQYLEGRTFVKNGAMDLHPIASAFAGDQTMEEREKSFKVQTTMKVHCGFCDEENEFFIDPRDKSFMAECQIVVLTCTFGGGDDLYQPIGMTKASLSQVCYVAFWDEVTLEVQALKGKEPDLQTRKVGLWRVVIVHNLPFSDQRRNGKIPKLLNHRLFPSARYSIWVDSKSQFRRDPIGVIEALLLRPKSIFAISEHGGRSCVYKEGEIIVKKHKALPEEVAIQLDQYHSEDFPELAHFDGHKALAEASVIVREHTPLTNLFMCNWFNEVMRFTARDQLSFPYVLVKLQAMHPNMFNICTRRALVNSIGHAGKKPKPLDIKWT